MPINPLGRGCPEQTLPPPSTATSAGNAPTITTVTMGAGAQNYNVITNSGSSRETNHRLRALLADAQQSTSAPVTVLKFKKAQWRAAIRAKDTGLSRALIANYFGVRSGMLSRWRSNCRRYSLDTQNIDDDPVCKALYDKLLKNCLEELGQVSAGTTSAFTRYSGKIDLIRRRYSPITSQQIYDTVKKAKADCVPTGQIEDCLGISNTSVRVWTGMGQERPLGRAAQQLYDDIVAYNPFAPEEPFDLSNIHNLSALPALSDQPDQVPFDAPHPTTLPPPIAETLAGVPDRELLSGCPLAMLRAQLGLTNNDLLNVVKQAREAGQSTRNIASYLGIAKRTVQKWIKNSDEKEVTKLEEKSQQLYDKIIAYTPPFSSDMAEPTATVSTPPAAPSVSQTSAESALTPTRIQEILRDWNNPFLTVTELAEKHGYSVETICRIAREITPRATPYPPVISTDHRHPATTSTVTSVGTEAGAMASTTIISDPEV